MKRIFTLLLFALTAFSFKSTAQCNAEFSWQLINGNTVHFTPVVNDSPLVHHEWNFGDGSPNTQQVSPTHSYLSNGSFAVVHTVVRHNSNGTAVCTQSITHIVIIQQAPPSCNLVVDFSWHPASVNPLTIDFTNLSTPLSPSDSITWSFGDGSYSTAVNPLHTYNIAGTYTVCLRVKKNNNTGPAPCVREICKMIVVQQPCNLVVDFNWTIAATNLLTVQFHNLSVPLAITDSITWTFGDNGVSHDVNPMHTYANAGTYTVCLIVKKNNNLPGTAPCIRYICKTVVIPLACNLVVDFSWHPTTTNLLTIEFANLSTPLSPSDSITWTFGDGTSSNTVNPVHTYTAAGTYTVCLRVKKINSSGSAPCVREICKTIIVTQPCNLQVNFSSQPDPGHPLRIKFTDLSSPLFPSDSIRWTFGDGTSVSGLQSDPNVANPTHDYAQGGTYTVCLRVKKNILATPIACVGEICHSIVIEQPCNFQPAFSWHLDSINHKKVYFTNLTITPTAAAIATWYFGDGTTATSWNAVHEYVQPGRYYVCLKVQLSNTCIKYTCDSVTVPVPLPPCNNQSNFTVLSTSTNSQTFTFVPAMQDNSAQYTWTFGDGTGSHDIVATHHYAQAGTYTACLTVWRSAGCASTTCKTVVVQPQFNCDSAHVSFFYQPDPQVPNKIHFYANTNVPILDQTWTITRLPVAAGTSPVTLHQNNPTYLFQDTGYYRVCLRAITLGGCVREYCSVIHITQVANVCELQAYPNPASTVVNVNVTLTQPEMINAYVYNSLNVVVLEKHQQGVTGNNVVSLNIGNLPAGAYTIKLIYGNHTCLARFQKL